MSSILDSLAHHIQSIVPTIMVVSISDLHTIPLSQVRIPPGDILIVAGDLSEGRPAQLMERLAQLQELPHPTKIVIGGNHDRALDIICDTRDAAELDDLEERQACRAAFRQAKQFGILYLEGESVEVVVHGRVLKVFGSPKSLALSKNTAFGYSRDDSAQWDLVPADTDIIVTHGPPTCYLSDNSNSCDELRKTLRRVRPLLHVFGHVHASYGTTTLLYDQSQEKYEVMRTTMQVKEQVRSGKYILLHLRPQKTVEEASLQQALPISPDASPDIAFGVYGGRRTQLVNAAVKTFGSPQDAIVVKI